MLPGQAGRTPHLALTRSAPAANVRGAAEPERGRAVPRRRQGGRPVRIGIDMIAVQSPHHGARGIGRLAANLVAALVERDDRHGYVFYVHEELPDGRVPRSPRAEYRTIRPRWE